MAARVPRRVRPGRCMQPATYSATTSSSLDAGPQVRHVLHRRAGATRGHHRHRRPAAAEPARCVGAVGDGARHRHRRRPSERLSVTASPNSHVLHVTVKASPPSRAADAANAAVAAFVDVRRDALGALRSDQLSQLRLHDLRRTRTSWPSSRPSDWSSRPPTSSSPRSRSSAPASTSSRRPASSPATWSGPAVAARNARLRQHRGPRGVRAPCSACSRGCLIGAGRDRLRQLQGRPHAPHTLITPVRLAAGDRHPSRGTTMPF